MCTPSVVAAAILLLGACTLAQAAAEEVPARGHITSTAVNSSQPFAQLLLNTPNNFPPYTRGKDAYQWILNKRGLAKGLTFLGPNDRLRNALLKLKSGQNITIATIGGSITAGQGAIDAPNWPTYMTNYLKDQYGAHIHLANGAVGGTLSSYMSVCLNIHVTKAADIVFVEYNQNDPSISQPLFGTIQRKQYERLLRKLLSYPNNPAVILMHSFTWAMSQAGTSPGQFWNSAEREFAEFAWYYGLPMLSTKSCCHQLMQEDVVGFKIHKTRNQDNEGLKDIVFNYDAVHPDGRTGMRVMGELAIHLVESTLASLETLPQQPDELAAVMAPLAAPMIENNYQTVNDTCFIGSHFLSVVTKKEGFEWINESKNVRSKWGMVATTVGSVLHLTINTQATTGVTTPGKQDVLVELAYLQSYEHMGRADVSCVSGCLCETTLMEGHTPRKTSLLHLLMLYVSPSPACVIEIKVRNDSQVPGEHKIKVSGIMVSEEAGRNIEGIKNHLAVEYVHDVTFQSNSSTFDVRNHVRRRLQQWWSSWW